MRLTCIWISLLLLPLSLLGTELSPWLDRDFVLQPRLTALYQRYRTIDSGRGNFRRHANDYFYTASIGGTALGMAAELETTVADTHHQRPSCDNIRLTGRYRLWDDISGVDPLTVTIGVTATQAFSLSVNDISSFHHGRIEGEAHLAFGSEVPCGAFWDSHWWGLVAIGSADKGSPWLRGDLTWEKNWYDIQQLRVFIHSLWGLGHRDLSPHRPFRGYGPIHHQSVDLGVRYSYQLFETVTLSAEYAYRLHARNFPAHAQLILLSLLYPIGL